MGLLDVNPEVSANFVLFDILGFNNFLINLPCAEEV